MFRPAPGRGLRGLPEAPGTQENKTFRSSGRVHNGNCCPQAPRAGALAPGARARPGGREIQARAGSSRRQRTQGAQGFFAFHEFCLIHATCAINDRSHCPGPGIMQTRRTSRILGFGPSACRHEGTGPTRSLLRSRRFYTASRQNWGPGNDGCRGERCQGTDYKTSVMFFHVSSPPALVGGRELR